MKYTWQSGYQDIPVTWPELNHQDNRLWRANNNHGPPYMTPEVCQILGLSENSRSDRPHQLMEVWKNGVVELGRGPLLRWTKISEVDLTLLTNELRSGFNGRYPWMRLDMLQKEAADKAVPILADLKQHMTVLANDLLAQHGINGQANIHIYVSLKQ